MARGRPGRYAAATATATVVARTDRSSGYRYYRRVEAVSRPAARYAVAVHDGPMVDLDGAYSAVGRSVVERAVASDGPVVERYLPTGDQDDPLAHRTEVCWPVSG